MVARFLHCKGTSDPLLHTVLFGRRSPKEWGLYPTPRGQSIYIHYLESSTPETWFFSLIHLLNYAFTSTWNHGYLSYTWGYIPQYNFILLFKLFQLWPLGTLSGWCLRPSDKPLNTDFFVCFCFRSMSLTS